MDVQKNKELKNKLKKIMDDPVLWAKAFVTTYDNATKEKIPWTARWYQAEMLRDNSLKKSYLCGRRTGKTETMIIEALYRVFNKKMFVFMFATPYENQIRTIFERINVILDNSKLLKEQLVRSTKNPYVIKFSNGSKILGFTTGSSSGNAGASLRGQTADWVALDEMDYMTEEDYDTVAAICAERSSIGITVSSTPTGARSRFYQICTNKKLGFTLHHHPSTHNPNWNIKMEEEFRSQLSASAYLHEIMAEFGDEDAGVFDKISVDIAMTFDDYAYNQLTKVQEERCKYLDKFPVFYLPNKGESYKPNIFRTMGIDWDKSQADSSLLVLDYDLEFEKFRVLKRVDFPKAKYSYDKAVQLIIEINAIYNPSWIYADRGAGEYQIERLHIYGDEHPETGLNVKVKGWQFAQSLPIPDPITKVTTKKPMKPFMVNMLAQAFERHKIILSPYDTLIHRQLINYHVVRIGSNGVPVYGSNDEHFVDALGLAYLAFVLEFPEITKAIKKIQPAATTIKKSLFNPGARGIGELKKIEYKNKDLWKKLPADYNDLREPRGEKQQWIQVPMVGKVNTKSWGTRSSTNAYRKSW